MTKKERALLVVEKLKKLYQHHRKQERPPLQGTPDQPGTRKILQEDGCRTGREDEPQKAA